jgi:hypothetical protein
MTYILCMTNQLSSDGYFTASEQDAMLLDETGEEALLSRIPLQVGSQKKALYLSYRATGFPVKQACALAECSMEDLIRWRKRDEHFVTFENEKLHELQATVGSDVVRLEFMRNFRMIMKKDFLVIHKALFDEASMTDAEWKYFLMVRKHYTPNDMLALEKAISPETHQSGGDIIIKLGWGTPELDRDDEDETVEAVQTTEYRVLSDGNSDPSD